MASQVKRVVSGAGHVAASLGIVVTAFLVDWLDGFGRPA